MGNNHLIRHHGRCRRLRCKASNAQLLRKHVLVLGALRVHHRQCLRAEHILLRRSGQRREASQVVAEHDDAEVADGVDHEEGDGRTCALPIINVVLVVVVMAVVVNGDEWLVCGV
jgi:hypothetical protein